MEQEKKLNEMQKELMIDLKMDELSEDQQQKLIIKMTEAVLKRIFIETMEKLKPGDQEIYQKMIEKEASLQEVENFLKEKIVNYDKMIEKIITNFKEEMKAGLKK